MDFSMPWFIVECWCLLILGILTEGHRRSRYNNDNYPSMMPNSLYPRPRLMCAELCFAGLGGDSCGSKCSNITDLPETFIEKGSKPPDKVHEENFQPIVGPRKKVCSKLCEYGLGRPLCGCKMQSKRKMSWIAICRAYCKLENFQLYGCPICDVVPLIVESMNSTSDAQHTHIDYNVELQSEPDWDEICRQLCSSADGGSACNCDFPPF